MDDVARPDVDPDGTAGGRAVSLAVDTAIGVTLGVSALLLRRHLPSDGFFFDDAWMAVGVSKASLANLVTVGQSQFGFTMLVVAWSHVFGRDGYIGFLGPTLVFGAMGPSLLFVALRRFGFARSVAALFGAMLAVINAHVIYSARVKSYTGDLVIVLVFTMLIPVLARRVWGPRTAIAWLALTFVLGSYSTFGLIAAAVAGLVIVLHPKADLRWRASAFAAQLIVHLAFFLITSRTYNSAPIFAFFRPYDAYINFSWNPITLALRVLRHWARVAYVFPGVHGIAAAACMTLVTVGLAFAAWRGPRTYVARYLLLLLAVAIVGGIAGKLPFGPVERGVTSPPFKAVLWMIPIVAVGIAVALETVRQLVARDTFLHVAFDALAFALAIALLLGAIGARRYYPTGARLASTRVGNEFGRNDVVWVTRFTEFSFALYSGLPYRIIETPQYSVGFEPKFINPRVHVLDFTLRKDEVKTSVQSADRVIVVNWITKLPYEQLVSQLGNVLTADGFELTSRENVHGTLILNFERNARHR